MVDREVQGALLWRAILYGAAGLLYMVLVLYLTHYFANQDASLVAVTKEFALDMLYWAPGLFVLVPVMLHDVVRTSNRFAGPLYRLRCQMLKLTKGQRSKRIRFRDGDYWIDFSDVFNDLRAEVLELRQRVAEAEAAAPRPPRTNNVATPTDLRPQRSQWKKEGKTERTGSGRAAMD